MTISIFVQIDSEDNDDLSPIVDELEYIEYSITGDTDSFQRRSLNEENEKRAWEDLVKIRQISGDEFPVYVDDFNYNLSPDVYLNLVNLTGYPSISNFYYYDVSAK